MICLEGKSMVAIVVLSDQTLRLSSCTTPPRWCLCLGAHPRETGPSWPWVKGTGEWPFGHSTPAEATKNHNTSASSGDTRENPSLNSATIQEMVSECRKYVHLGLTYTRIMVSKGMVSKSKYSISEKNKGMPVSICPYF